MILDAIQACLLVSNNTECHNRFSTLNLHVILLELIKSTTTSTTSLSNSINTLLKLQSLDTIACLLLNDFNDERKVIMELASIMKESNELKDVRMKVLEVLMIYLFRKDGHQISGDNSGEMVLRKAVLVEYCGEEIVERMIKS